ncbi:ArgS-related anticodon-binding protein NrtL [Streptomyces sp. NPDC053493]|uniref:ArgS-related anticodon-binding protein NrtL n=1 Tax=Streptomyces sp. NPDC053493 TaxID=3365705 RepID=UPI0037D672BB
MTPADLSLTVLHAVRRAVDEGALRVEVPARVKVERPRPGGVGDYASSVALSLARPSGRPPLDVALILKERLHRSPGIRAVDITGPGFLNFTLDEGSGERVVREIARAGLRYGHSDALAGASVRFAAVREDRARLVTETVIRLLRAQGADATTADGPEGPDGERLHVRPEGPRLQIRPDGQRLPGSPAPHAAVTDGPGVERLPVRPAPYAVDELGPDAARWALLRAAAGDQALAGGPLLVQHERNGLFRVRYAHSRARALIRNGAQLGVTPGPEAYEGTGDAAALLALLGDHPAVLLSAARHRAPDRVARHLEAVADALLAFQHTVLPLGDEKPSAAHRSRLALAEAAGTVLAGGLSLLGISAPDQI